MRLIDADALIEELNNSHFPGAPYVDAGISIAVGKVLDAPTIEPKTETKTPRWVAEDRFVKGHYFEYPHCPKCNGELTTGQCYCSICGQHIAWDEKEGEADES